MSSCWLGPPTPPPGWDRALGSPAASPSWKIQSTPNPSGSAGNALNGVSCTSATSCTAVGTYTSTSGSIITLAEQWNGTTWTIRTTPKPTGSSELELEGVSCTSASACNAVGGYENSSGADQTLAEQWNGTSWTIHATTNPGPSRTTCTAHPAPRPVPAPAWATNSSARAAS